VFNSTAENNLHHALAWEGVLCMKEFLKRVLRWPNLLLDPQVKFQNMGYCFSCGRNTQFVARDDWWRDHYRCDHCGSIPRERALMYCVEKFFPNWRDLIIHESSPADRGASKRLRHEAKNYIPSQYFPDIPLGTMHKSFRCENLEKLTFLNNSIDLHISQDVFEHIFDPAQAFREIARTLKPGGAHIFTVPLVNKNSPTDWRARMRSDGTIEHLIFPPEYHDNPVSENGSLVTVHWGFDIVKFIHDACGLFTEMVYIDALELGIRAEYIEVLITRK
jgi:SAM-dependent methyltransferase